MKLNKQYESNGVFSDMLFNVLCVIIVCLAMAILLINPKAPPDVNVKKDANFIAEVIWPEDIDCDVDMWVKGPSGTVSFNKKSDQIMHIERDDMGISTDTLSDVSRRILEGRDITPPLKTVENREVWTLRGISDGRYTINAHLYNCKNASGQIGYSIEVPVTIKLIRVNPYYETLVLRTKPLNQVWQEITLVKFELSEKSKVFEDYGDDFEEVVELPRGKTLR